METPSRAMAIDQTAERKRERERDTYRYVAILRYDVAFQRERGVSAKMEAQIRTDNTEG